MYKLFALICNRLTLHTVIRQIQWNGWHIILKLCQPDFLYCLFLTEARLVQSANSVWQATQSRLSRKEWPPWLCSQSKYPGSYSIMLIYWLLELSVSAEQAAACHRAPQTGQPLSWSRGLPHAIQYTVHVKFSSCHIHSQNNWTLPCLSLNQ